MRKGIFIPDITVEMFKNASLESVEELLVSGTMEDIEITDRPKGEWIFKNGKYRCNACGEKAIYRYNGMSNIPEAIITDFCPNCGSDNRKRSEA